MGLLLDGGFLESDNSKNMHMGIINLISAISYEFYLWNLCVRRGFLIMSVMNTRN